MHLILMKIIVAIVIVAILSTLIFIEFEGDVDKNKFKGILKYILKNSLKYILIYILDFFLKMLCIYIDRRIIEIFINGLLIIFHYYKNCTRCKK